ncbi:nucleotidyl transferase AbiEii/AbiGii toxin family protein [Candidatus Gottesmanbacteria bacterium]|nr:nucleotidyl transferase AbiEii/AbiGii toxin family protein [Candidatus Gottesmanbacteria bacterium]
MSSIHHELLSTNQLAVLKKLRVFKKKAVLAGGTALSLQLAHRYSFDFDLFQDKIVSPHDLHLLNKILKIREIVFKSSDMLVVKLESDISFSLVYYWFKPLYPKIDAGYLHLFDYRDIALDKAETIGRRATWRDYFDLFYILQNTRFSIKDILAGAKIKFRNEFSQEQFLTQLTYFDDLGEFDLKFVKKKYRPDEIKKFLTNEVEKFTTKLILKQKQ